MPLARMRERSAAKIIGKAKAEDGAAREAAHRGRGASSFADQSRAIYNLEKDPITETVTISCAKIKGPRFDDHVLRLDVNTRWFTQAGEIRRRSSYELLLDLFEGGRALTTAEAIEGCRGKSSERAVKDNLKMAKDLGDLVRLRQGLYQRPSISLIGDETESAESAGRI